MRVYGHSYRDTMSLPMRVFWNISGSVPRLIAGEKKDKLELLVTATLDPGRTQEAFLNLDEMSPNPVTLTSAALIAANSVRDDVGFDELRSM